MIESNYEKAKKERNAMGRRLSEIVKEDSCFGNKKNKVSRPIYTSDESLNRFGTGKSR